MRYTVYAGQRDWLANIFANPLRIQGQSHLGACSQGTVRSTKRSFDIPAR